MKGTVSNCNPEGEWEVLSFSGKLIALYDKFLIDHNINLDNIATGQRYFITMYGKASQEKAQLLMRFKMKV